MGQGWTGEMVNRSVLWSSVLGLWGHDKWDWAEDHQLQCHNNQHLREVTKGRRISREREEKEKE